MSDERRVWVQTVRIPADGVDDFNGYEDIVLPLLPEYDGRLDARYRGDEGRFEVHVVSFPTQDALDAYRLDARRQAAQHLLARSGATTELLEVRPVT
ncbi:MAG: hypothetical protein ABI912_09605 [Actinomycetota bacterium]